MRRFRQGLPEFVAEVKKKPGSYAHASAGGGTTTHAASLIVLKAAGLRMIHVPYKGVAPAFGDLAIAKEVQAAVKTKAFSDKLIQVGLEPVGSTPEEMVATIAAGRQNWLAIKGDLAAATQ